jgi:hypothetical protein
MNDKNWKHAHRGSATHHILFLGSATESPISSYMLEMMLHYLIDKVMIQWEY